MIRYSPEYLGRALRWRESSVATYRELFPTRSVSAPAEPHLFKEAPEHAEIVSDTFEAIFETPDLDGYYKYMWYGFFRGDDGCDFMAEGDRGQFIFVAPHKRLIIVRNGLDWGISSSAWIEGLPRIRRPIGTVIQNRR